MYVYIYAYVTAYINRILLKFVFFNVNNHIIKLSILQHNIHYTMYNILII